MIALKPTKKNFNEVLLANMYHDLDVIKANIDNDKEIKR